MKTAYVFISLFLGSLLTWCNESTISAQPAKSRRKDSLCETETNKAKKDVANGKLVYCYPFGFGSTKLRQEKQLEVLCKNVGLLFEYELFSDVIVAGQTQGCYGDFMDSKIAEKYGTGFKKMLLRKADSLLAVSNDTIEDYLCDQRPQLIGKPSVTHMHLTAELPDSLRTVLATDSEGNYPFVEIAIVLDKQGGATGYFMGHFYDARAESNKHYKMQLARLGVTELKKYKFTPGYVMGYSVNTRANVRMHFQ